MDWGASLFVSEKYIVMDFNLVAEEFIVTHITLKYLQLEIHKKSTLIKNQNTNYEVIVSNNSINYQSFKIILSRSHNGLSKEISIYLSGRVLTC